jgi:hypothetical protein
VLHASSSAAELAEQEEQRADEPRDGQALRAGDHKSKPVPTDEVCLRSAQRQPEPELHQRQA